MKHAIFSAQGLLLAALAMTQLPACSEAPDAGTTSQLMSDDTPTELGQGRNGITGKQASRCFEKINQTEEAPGSPPFNIRFVHGKGQLADALGIPLGQLQAGGSNNPLIQMILNLEFQPRMTHLLVSIKRVSRELKVNQPTLDRTMQNLYDTNYSSFVASCGDSFVASVEYGDGLVAVIPIVVDSEKQKSALESDINTARSNATLVFQRLQKYAVLKAPALKLGSANPTTLSFQDLSNSFLGLYNDTTPLNEIKIGPVFHDYGQDLLPSRDANQRKRSDFMRAHQILSTQLLTAEQCRVRIEKAQANPLEFSAPTGAPLSTYATAIPQEYDALGDSLETCLANSCENKVCEPTQCVSPAIDNALAPNCETAGPQIQETDSIIYRQWLDANGSWGSMKGLSETVGNSHAQSFEKGRLVRPNFANNAQVIVIKDPVFQRWKTMLDVLQAPRIKAPYAYGNPSAEVTEFEGGSLFLTQAQQVFLVRNFMQNLNGRVPVGDEQSIVKSASETWSRLDLSDGTTGWLRTGRPVVNLQTHDSLNTYLDRWGGLNWTVPTDAVENPSIQTWYFRVDGGHSYWKSHSGSVVGMSPNMFALIQRMGGIPGVGLGMPTWDESCANNVCTMYFERGNLQVYIDSGKRVCGDKQHEGTNGQCVQNPDIAHICVVNPAMCTIRVPPIRLPIPPVVVIPRGGFGH